MDAMGVGAGSRWRPWIATVGLAVGILIASLVPLPRSGEPAFGPYGPDKLLHLLGHAALAGTLAAAVSSHDDSGPRTAAIAATTSTVHGLGGERLQERVPGRAPEPADRWAIALGSILGALAWLLFSLD